MKKRLMVVCDSCGCVPCDCNSPKVDHFDNDNYDPWSSVDADEATVEELTALLGLAAA